MSLTRLALILSILLLLYCVVLVAALAAPLGWYVLGAVVLVLLCRKRGQMLDAFGTARWACYADVRHMIGGNGLIIGYMADKPTRMAGLKALFDSSLPADLACQDFLESLQRDAPAKLLRLNGAVHTAVFAPTGVGKGVSIVLPYLLSCPDSMVVLDYKGENFKLTANARRKMGHKIVVLDPFKMVTETPDTFNPLCIDKDDPNALDECRSLAAEIVIRDQEKGDGVHFLDNAESAIAAIIALVVHSAPAHLKSLQMVCELVSSPENWAKSIDMMTKSTAWDGMLARMGENLKHLKERELASTMTTINRFLRFLSTPALVASTTSSSFNPDDLLNHKGKMTVYLVIPPQFIISHAAILRIWIGSITRAVVRGGLQEKKLVRMILDEAASLSHMDAIDNAVDKLRGYGLRLLFLFQSHGQIKKCFPEQEQTLLSNVSTIYFGINDLDTAKAVSERLGKSTIIVTSGGTGTSFQVSTQQSHQGSSTSFSQGSNTSSNWQQSGRELAQPSELMTLSERIAIIFTPGASPLWTTLVRYYEAGFKKAISQSRIGAGISCKALVLLALVAVLAFGLTLMFNDVSSRRNPASAQFERWPNR